MTSAKAGASDPSGGPFVWLEKAVAASLAWVAVAVALSFLWAPSLFAPGDFEFSEAMLYHSVMVPLLVLFFLLSSAALRLSVSRARWFAALAIFAVFFAGVGALFDRHTGISLVTGVQVAGMAATDLVGAVLFVALVLYAVREKKQLRGIRAAFWLLFVSVGAVLLAAPLGHLAGWGLDLGLTSFPGVAGFLERTGLQPGDFQEALISSHSHLIVAALLCGLTAVAALTFDYASSESWRLRLSRTGLWVSGVTLVATTGLYLVSASTGWEPPALFASGPNGMPLDDALLTLMEVGFLLLAVGLSGRLQDRLSNLRTRLRSAVRWNWAAGFVAAVALGVYIEFHEGYYGGGELPAAGALKDQAFVRAHMLLPFLFLPVALVFLLAVTRILPRLSRDLRATRLFANLTLLGMALGVVGELLWFVGAGRAVFVAGSVVLAAAFVLGAGLVLLADSAETKG